MRGQVLRLMEALVGYEAKVEGLEEGIAYSRTEVARLREENERLFAALQAERSHVTAQEHLAACCTAPSTC